MTLRLILIAWLPFAAGCTGDSLVACTSNDDCLSFGAVCDNTGHCAQPGADASIDLAGDLATDGGGDASGPECTTPQQCTDPSKPFCDAQSMKCRGCKSSDCTNPKPFCAANGACVQCLTKDDCASTNQTCNQTTLSCGPCKAHSECTTGVCTPNGTCAPAGMVAYVNNATAACMDVPHTSSPSAPYCQVLFAVLNAGVPYILASGSSTAYDSLAITTVATTVGPVLIVGPGRNAVPTAKIAPTATSAVLINTGGSPATVSIDGFELIGSGGGTPNPAVKCSQNTGAATLSIVNSSMHGSGQAGVDSSGCTVTLDANTINTNAGGGIKLADTTYKVSNNFIVDNGLAGPGVLLSGNSTGLFWFNTIAGNKRSGTQAGAFNCGGVTAATAPAIQASIVWGNDKLTGSSVGTGCNFTFCDIDDLPLPSGAGNFATDPLFLNAANGDYHLNSTSPCKNKVTSATGLSGGTLPNHDVDENPRPRAATGGYDTGANQIIP